jgi:hypothetical protein
MVHVQFCLQHLEPTHLRMTSRQRKDRTSRIICTKSSAVTGGQSVPTSLGLLSSVCKFRHSRAHSRAHISIPANSAVNKLELRFLTPHRDVTFTHGCSVLLLCCEEPMMHILFWTKEFSGEVGVSTWVFTGLSVGSALWRGYRGGGVGGSTWLPHGRSHACLQVLPVPTNFKPDFTALSSSLLTANDSGDPMASIAASQQLATTLTALGSSAASTDEEKVGLY